MNEGRAQESIGLHGAPHLIPSLPALRADQSRRLARAIHARFEMSPAAKKDGGILGEIVRDKRPELEGEAGWDLSVGMASQQAAAS